MWLPILDTIFKVIDKVVPDPQAKAEAQRKVLELQQQGEFKELEKRYEAITAEAKSTDPFTSRARPSFLYVFYTILLSLTVVAPSLAIATGSADALKTFYEYVGMGFKALPEELWWAFTAGFLGYTTARSYEKKKVIA